MFPKVTILLAILSIIFSVYFWEYGNNSFLAEFGFSYDNLLAGKYWVIITSIFLHSSLDHLISNLFALLLFGIPLEKNIGSGRLLLIFLFGAFLGQVFAVLYYGPSQIAIGASAGIFSLIACALILVPITIEAYFFPIPLALFAIGYLIYTIIGAMANYPPNVAHISHIAGALVGLSYGFYKKGVKKGIKIIIAAFFMFLLAPFLFTFLLSLVKFIISLF